MNQAQEFYFLEKLLSKVTNPSESELIANRLLRLFGSADQAFQEISNGRFRSLEIDNDLVELCTCIHKLNLEAKYRHIAVSPPRDVRRKVFETFIEEVGMMSTCCVQFYYFCGDMFVFAGSVRSGTIDSVIFYKREVLSEALTNNANRVLPVIGMPFSIRSPINELLSMVENLAHAGEILSIEVDEPIFISNPDISGAFRNSELPAPALSS